MFMFRIPVWLLLLALNASSFAATRYVNVDGATPTPPYTGWETAATNIQDAIDVSVAGDEIVVTNGIYKTGGRTASGATTNRVVLDKAIIVRSVNGSGATAIEGAPDAIDPNGFGVNSIRCAYVGSDAILAGFTLRNGTTTHGEHGGGLLCEKSAIVTNCVIANNLAGWQGGGIYGGMVYRCKILDNSAASGGGAAASILFDSVLAGNEVGEAGGGAYQCALYNCTVVTNRTFESGGGVWGCSVNNSIVYFNSGFPFGGAPNHVGGTFTNSCTSPLPATGLNNINGDPLLVDLAAGNYRLQSNSPCIDAGNSHVTTSTDLDGRLRVVGSAIDMGGYELQPGVTGAFLGWLQDYNLPADGTADSTDADDDWSNNWQEWRAGTDPTNPLSVLRLLPLSNIGSDSNVRWTSVTNRTYIVERSTNSSLGPAGFEPLASGLAGQAGTTTYIDTNAVGDVRFYRIRVE